MHAFTTLTLAFAALALAAPTADPTYNPEDKEPKVGCVENCPTNPIGGWIQAEKLSSGLGGGLIHLDVDVDIKVDATAVATSSYFYYSYGLHISQAFIYSFNYRLQSFGCQPTTSISEFLTILELHEEVTIEEFFVALLGQQQGLIGSLFSSISIFFGLFNISQQSTISAFFSSCGIELSQPIYVLFFKLGIWRPACQLCL